MFKRLFVVILILVLSGCNKQTLLPLSVGNYWYLTDQATGHITKFTITEFRNIGCQGAAFNLFISKDHIEDYWAPGYSLNTNFFVKWTTDGLLVSPASYNEDFTKTPTMTMNYHASNDIDPTPYKLTAKIDNFLTTMLTRNHVGVYYPCMNLGDSGVILSQQDGIWRMHGSLKAVNTPVYKGLAQCWRYSEGAAQPVVWDVNNENNAEEWCFAPKIGLVQLTNIHFHYAGIDYENGCQFDGVTDPAKQLKGVDWVACTVPSGLVSRRIPNMVLKLTQYKVN